MDVCELFFRRQFYQASGLSIKDVMDLDLTTFELISKYYTEFTKVKEETVENLNKELELIRKKIKKSKR